MKTLTRIYLVLVLTGYLAACSTPEEKAADYVENGQALLQANKLDKAEVEFKNALQINQNLVDALYGLAVISEKRQEWRNTYTLLNKIRELNPNHIDGRVKLGQILLVSNQLDQALLDAKEILKLAPNDARAYALMAAVHLRLENIDDALSEAEKSLKIDANNSDALLVKARILITQEQIAQALAVLDSGIKTDPANMSLYLMKIRVFQETNNIAAIEKTYLTLVDRFPDNLSIRHALARNYIINKQVDNAEVVLARVLDDFPNNVDEKLRLIAFKNQYRSIDESIALLKNYIEEDKDEYRFGFALGQLYENDGQDAKALAVYKEIIADDKFEPNGLEARNKIALIEIRKGNRDIASKLIDEVLETDKNNENAMLITSGFQLTDRKFDDAIVSLRKVLRNNPQSTRTLGLLGKAYEAKGSNEQAVKSYADAYQISPTAPAIANQYAGYLLRQGKPEKADEVLLDSISRGNRSLVALKLLAQIKLSLKDWDMAEKLAKQIKNAEGQEAVSQQLLGLVYQGQQQQDASISAFERAYELSPSSSQPIVSLVQTYIRNGKPDEARKFLKSVVSDHSENVTAYLLLGRLDLAEKNTAEAERHFLKALEINPTLTSGYRRLASIYLRSENNEKAEKILNRGLVEMPDNIQLGMTLASVFEKSQKFDESIALYETLLEKNPDLVVAKNNLANLLIDYKSDEASLNKALQISREFKDSEIPQLQDTYAWASVRADRSIYSAIIILKGIVKENAEIPIYSYHLGEAYFKKGDNIRAAQYLKQAIKYGEPDSDTTVQASKRLQQLSQ